MPRVLSSAIFSLKMIARYIDKSKLRTFWYEDADGNFTGELPDSPDNIPSGSKYQISRVPTVLRTVCHDLDDGHEVFVGESSWSADLVLAMVKGGDYTLDEAIIIAGESCERCMNSLAYEYGLDWGYAEGSKEWQKSNTVCEFCKND